MLSAFDLLEPDVRAIGFSDTTWIPFAAAASTISGPGTVLSTRLNDI